MNKSLLKLVYGPLINRALKKALWGRLKDPEDSTLGRFSSADIREIRGHIWARSKSLLKKVPPERSIGGRLNMQFACFTLSAFEVLMKKGINRTYAIDLVSEVTWRLFRQWGTLVFAFAVILTTDRAKRMGIAVGALMRFPFSPPTYVFERFPAPDGVHLDILRCPAAEYFRANDAEDLCTKTWCDLDFPLAEMWGGRLERGGTLAAGCDRCDFRFKADIAA